MWIIILIPSSKFEIEQTLLPSPSPQDKKNPFYSHNLCGNPHKDIQIQDTLCISDSIKSIYINNRLNLKM